jgi:hypothetical protein
MATLRINNINNIQEADYYTATVSLLVVFLFAFSILLVWGIPNLTQIDLSQMLVDAKNAITIERIR